MFRLQSAPSNPNFEAYPFTFEISFHRGNTERIWNHPFEDLNLFVPMMISNDVIQKERQALREFNEFRSQEII